MEEELERRYKKEKAWGLSSMIDLHGCSISKITDANAIKRFVVELCKMIDMKRFGECHVVNFGEDEAVAGYSMMQLIETSLISGHFADSTKRVFLDVFSCKFYSPEKVAEFAKEFFEAESYSLKVWIRK